jgi:hypothetical protein
VRMDRDAMGRSDGLRPIDSDEVHREACSGEDLERRDRVELVDSVVDEDLNLLHAPNVPGPGQSHKWQE